MKSFNELKKNLKRDLSNLPVIKVALLGDVATQFLTTAIRGVAVEYGYNIDIYEAPFNQVEMQLFNPNSELYAFQPQYTVVLQSTHKLNEKYSMMTPEGKKGLAEQRINFVGETCKRINGNVIYYNYPEIEDTVFGSYANAVPVSFTYQVRKLNYELMKMAEDYKNLFICDIAGVQNKFGRDFIFDASIYTSTEMVFSLNAVPWIASRTVDIIMASLGKVKKCLILDLDNTLWGGVIGDDGIDGIELGHGLGVGKIFTEFQQWIKKLKDRGIILCVCSKNDEDKAKEPFEKHPEMVLKLEDIAVFMANWETKVKNIYSIKEILNIGFDSMVFIDDNPFERNMVRENIKDIIVPELPEDPAEYLEYLYSLNLFETTSYAEMDGERTKQYKEQAERVVFANSFEKENDFLESLNMESRVEKFTEFNIPRVAQLSQRSNQFNLRTVRYNEYEIKEISLQEGNIGMAFSLSDRFGDNGLIAVVIMKALNAEELFIDTWFMSCRVLKRGMELFTLNCMVSKAKELGYKKIIGEYIPTAKNGLVKEHYTKLGFYEIKGSESMKYGLTVDAYKVKECYIKEIG